METMQPEMNQPQPRADIIQEEVKRLTKGVQGFADEMKAKNIHIGMGKDPYCVTCGEKWPCQSSMTPQPRADEKIHGWMEFQPQPRADALMEGVK